MEVEATRSATRAAQTSSGESLGFVRRERLLISRFRRISLTTILDNPAPLILHTNQVSFEVLYKSALVGRAYVDPLDLLEGESAFISFSRLSSPCDTYAGTNTLPTEFHYMVSTE